LNVTKLWLGRECKTANPQYSSWISKWKIHPHLIHSSMALQPFVRPWPLLQFREPFYTDGRTP
jgi:hypothetical protein